MNKINTPLVIVANGEFPQNKIPLKILKNANYIITCDGATDKLLKNGFEPNLIIGDLDSISAKSKDKYHHIIISPNMYDPDMLGNMIVNMFKRNITKDSLYELFIQGYTDASLHKEDLDEIFLLSNRIAVLHSGRITGIFDRNDGRQKVGNAMVQ